MFTATHHCCDSLVALQSKPLTTVTNEMKHFKHEAVDARVVMYFVISLQLN